ncbi:MAG: methylthioribose-1-phosphate isomerase [Gammaproteobacteria bacterium]|jgi:methylthioribose-1-phosphate isomerase
MIEQTLLPLEERALEVRTVEEMVDAIYRLAVRGAPAIGVAAAYGVLLGVQELSGLENIEVEAHVREVAATLAKSRPTAVNLFWALDRMVSRAKTDREAGKSGDEMVTGLFEEAMAIHTEDDAQCRRMGELGAELLSDGQTILTHCNAGALATGGMGTALAPIYVAKEQGKRIHVFADETRPLLQGARLTAWELTKAGIETTVITDNMAASVMRSGKIDRVIVGSDRIARNGDVCNKIGTYGVAVLAQHHGIPFTVVAPLTTFDAKVACGADIPIEERPREEVSEGFGRRTITAEAGVYNPAFDYTPASMVSEIVTEAGVISAPDQAKVEAILRAAGRLE